MHASASSNATRELEDVKVMEKEKTMHASRHATRELEDVKVPVNLKLAGLWASVMFMFVYVDVIGFYRPGVIEAILKASCGSSRSRKQCYWRGWR